MRQSIFRSTEDLGAFYVKPSGDRSYDRLRILRKRLIHDRRVHPRGRSDERGLTRWAFRTPWQRGI